MYNFMDIVLKDEIKIEDIVKQLDEGTTVMLEKEDGNIFILNNINVLALEIVNNIPPISK